MQFTDDQVAALRTVFPHLVLAEPDRIAGFLDFQRRYVDAEIMDSFEIAMEATDDIPVVKETGGRTVQIADKHGVVNLAELHRSFDGSACLGVPAEIRKRCPPGTSLLQFVESLVVPYFFGLAFFERNGTWPWAAESHGLMGLLEYYARDEVSPLPADAAEVALVVRRFVPLETRKKWKPLEFGSETKCLCASGEAFGDCHPLALKGLIRSGALLELAGDQL